MDDQETRRASGGVRSRKLRIAFSAACGMLCLLLIVLWVRSYSSIDHPRARYYLLEVFVSTYRGLVITDVDVNQTSESVHIPNVEWGINSFPMRDKFTYYLMNKQNVYSLLGFRWNSVGSINEIDIPFWFLVLMAGGLGTMPWIRQFQWRFSLRTLLIATTLLAAVLGVIVWLIR
jgi:hypothetical protein